jgi:GNAT superfamily N-acetyltransferase
MDFAISLAAEEGWNPGNNDGTVFYNTDPNGFFVGELDGEVIACKSAVRYADKFGFMGFYIVKKDYRGKNYGIQLWKHAFNRLKDISSGMDGVAEQQANYAKSGYSLAYRQLRYEGKEITGKPSVKLEDLKDVSIEEIIDYDTSIFPAPRPVFLRLWLSQPNIFVKISTQKNKINGYGVIRPCQVGYKIGPLFADNELIAENLCLALIEFAEGKEVYIDVPDVNKPALELIEKYDMRYVFETARMYNNGRPQDNPEKVFGVTTFELG